jgi:hypothetical protein
VSLRFKMESKSFATMNARGDGVDGPLRHRVVPE